jgi:hypothetical protein
MSAVKHHCVLVHSEVIEAVWVLAVSQEEAKHMARARDGRQEIDRSITEVSICASEEVLS